MWKKRINLLALCIFSSLDNSVTSTDVCRHIQVQYWPQTTSMQSQIKKVQKIHKKNWPSPPSNECWTAPTLPGQDGPVGRSQFHRIPKIHRENQHQKPTSVLHEQTDPQATNYHHKLTVYAVVHRGDKMQYHVEYILHKTPHTSLKAIQI